MTRYLIRNRRTEVIYEIEAWYAEQAFARLGWNPHVGEYDCYILGSDSRKVVNTGPVRVWSV